MHFTETVEHVVLLEQC